MSPIQTQKQIVVTNALSRVKRASELVEFALTTRRLEVLAMHFADGQRCYDAVIHVLDVREHSSNKRQSALRSSSLGADQSFGAVALKFVLEPAQCAVLAGSMTREADAAEASQISGRCVQPCAATDVFSPNVGQIAWGALSLRKVLGYEFAPPERATQRTDVQKRESGQLSLQDLSIIECAVSYLDNQIDYSVMRHLSERGAAFVHRVAMLIATEFSFRIDNAIATAIRVLIDPLVGGDFEHCCCMLKRRQFPAIWVQKYELK